MVTVFNIDPCSKPRMTRSDRWKKRPPVLRYFEFKDELNKQAAKFNYKIELPLSITFVIPMPSSWSNKKKSNMENKPHTSRPDLDNLIKAFKDALLDEDSHVWWYGEMKKVWGFKGRIIVY